MKRLIATASIALAGMLGTATAQETIKIGALYNLTGGIDAWSLEVDPSVPRY